MSRILKALFALEDAREIIRKNAPLKMSDEDRRELSRIIQDVKQILSELEGSEDLKIGKIPVRDVEERFININPIQAAGRLTPEARKAIMAYGDGYSVCDYCRGRLDEIENPPLHEFHAELADFLGMDVARVVPGARRGFQIVTHSLVEKGDYVVLSSLAHYTEYLAVEDVGGIPVEADAGSENILKADAVAQKIEEVKSRSGKLPKLVMVEHFDYSYGNEHDVRSIAKVAHEYGIPVLYNGAYSVGVMPVDGRDLGVDFIIGSGHKSMASLAPSGVLATNEEYASQIFRTSRIRGDISGRSFGMKEVELLGCTLMGATVISMMASFPRVKERVKHWDEEVKKSNHFIREFLRIRGNRVLSEMPRKHTLSRVDTSKTFDVIARNHKRRGFFLFDELKRRGIFGIFPGATKVWKLNTYGLSWDQIRYLAESFLDIANAYGLEVA